MQKVRPIDANALRNKICAACAERLACTDIGNICFEVACIDNAPTIEPEVRHGRWIPTEYDSYADGAPVWDKWECSECNNEHSGEENTLSAFCPECGARMDGGADNG